MLILDVKSCGKFINHDERPWEPTLVVLLQLLWVSYIESFLRSTLKDILSDGRRPIYLLSILLQCIGSLAVAAARTVPELLAWRVIQALGASSGLSVGMGVIGDIYKLEERGTASGVFFAVRIVDRLAR